jgi:hypothetical protein
MTSGKCLSKVGTNGYSQELTFSILPQFQQALNIYCNSSQRLSSQRPRLVLDLKLQRGRAKCSAEQRGGSQTRSDIMYYSSQFELIVPRWVCCLVHQTSVLDNIVDLDFHV